MVNGVDGNDLLMVAMKAVVKRLLTSVVDIC